MSPMRRRRKKQNAVDYIGITYGASGKYDTKRSTPTISISNRGRNVGKPNNGPQSGTDLVYSHGSDINVNISIIAPKITPPFNQYGNLVQCIALSLYNTQAEIVAGCPQQRNCRTYE